ncbi:ShlB/FhaC/HecB family hemolysin secretion/activation protein [Rhodoferax saidenbachensis]|uniref:Polymerase n=1 Tax=Rhodoferax saidenbachensis TaxID=1484693 RepID=A0A1P8KE75_9BURK|nr:ShlB/FhaC/HecB family hemolysin secretion/activation protein [Rhodoferax saidenbachensis]APW44323.1 polymerase [Rhodoferax saidenbachensis]
MKKNTVWTTSTLLALSFSLSPIGAYAQTAPDAGQTLQQLQPTPAAPRESQPLKLQPAAPTGITLPGGGQVVLQSVRFSGNTAIPQETLQAAVAGSVGQSMDLAGLQALASRTSALYRASGYPFATAFLPPQTLTTGALRIQIVEGRYGKVQAVGDDAPLVLKADRFLGSLQAGVVIETAALERATLILDDQPGIKTLALMRPGEETGTGNLEVRITRERSITGDAGVDNFGNRYSGEYRARANLNINSPFTLGDQISLRLLGSDENLWLGSVGYGLPLGTSGLRGNVGYAYTRYMLGKEFAYLQANGTAIVSSAGLSYPLIRSQKTNLTLIGTYQYKELQDNKDSTATHESKASESTPLVLQFDRRDTLGGGGITYGSATWTGGSLRMDTALTAADSNQTRGSFNKLNLDVVRLQNLAAGWSLMGRFSMQTASKNLDSSEKTSLGGPGGVRAYPTGEASGDEAMLAQLELRYALGLYTPYLFMDSGIITVNTRPALGANNNQRTLSGSGLGLRYQNNGWNADAALAWRTEGGAPQSDTSSDPAPRAWVSAGYKF